jgi:glycogen debranching enzyme
MGQHLRGLISGCIAALIIVGAAAAQTPPLSYALTEGKNLNLFYRQGETAAHILARSGEEPRLLVAFPAGDSGVGLWFKPLPAPATWRQVAPVSAIEVKDAKGRILQGVETELETTAPRLEPLRAILSSVRVLRDYQALGTAPAELDPRLTASGDTLTYARDRLDGAPGYRLSLTVESGRLESGAIVAAPGRPLRLKLLAASGEPPLTPLSGAELFNGKEQPDEAAKRTLSFLSYKQKFLAGSWRFNTYFGRDTLMSLNLLAPVLTPQAIEAGLGAVLSRVSPQGEVAHEEDIGEFAILDHKRLDHTLSDQPTYNYVMIDSDYMLAPVATSWLLSPSTPQTVASSFLAQADLRQGEPSRAFGQDLVRNLRYVVEQAQAFARAPIRQNLIAIKAGVKVGEWRDSNDGLADGRYPYDVNAVFVPAALDAIARLNASGLLAAYTTPQDRALFDEAAGFAAVWRAHAPEAFEVRLDNADARRKVAAYAAQLHINPRPALQSLGDAPVEFPALSLTADGQPVPVVNSDGGFALLFAKPSPPALDAIVSAMMRPFPAGLLTDVGVVVADPVFASADLKARLSPNAYHGSVVWSWQQAVFAAGLDRQLARKDLPAATRTHLKAARTRLWQVIDAASAVRNSELWSWTYSDGHFHVAPFGANGADADESNAAQLWSTVFLALSAPKP